MELLRIFEGVFLWVVLAVTATGLFGLLWIPLVHAFFKYDEWLRRSK